MRTTLDIPNDLMLNAIFLSGARTKKQAVNWALGKAVRQKAIDDLLAHKVPIDFTTTPQKLEEREIRDQYENKRHTRRG